MKVITWNIAGGHKFLGRIETASDYGEENLQYFIREIKEQNPDFVCLQEIHDKPSQTQEIAKQISFKFVDEHAYGPSHIEKGQNISLGNICNLDAKNSTFHLLPNPNISVIRPNGDKWVSYDVGFLITTVELNGIGINFANCHLVPFHYFNRDFSEDQFKPFRDAIVDLLIKLCDKPTIVLGDFNYADLEKLFPNIIPSFLKEAFRVASTVPGKDQQDHILFSKHWDLNSAKVIETKSDHYLCEAQFNLKE